MSLAQLYTSRQTDKANPENGREGGGGDAGAQNRRVWARYPERNCWKCAEQHTGRDRAHRLTSEDLKERPRIG